MADEIFELLDQLEWLRELVIKGSVNGSQVVCSEQTLNQIQILRIVYSASLCGSLDELQVALTQQTYVDLLTPPDGDGDRDSVYFDNIGPAAAKLAELYVALGMPEPSITHFQPQRSAAIKNDYTNPLESGRRAVAGIEAMIHLLIKRLVAEAHEKRDSM